MTLLFTDVVMPEMDGRELAEEAARRRPGLEVLFTSSYTLDAVIRDGLPDPATTLLPKPFGLDQLVERVRIVIEVPAETLPPAAATPQRQPAA